MSEISALLEGGAVLGAGEVGGQSLKLFSHQIIRLGQVTRLVTRLVTREVREAGRSLSASVRECQPGPWACMKSEVEE